MNNTTVVLLQIADLISNRLPDCSVDTNHVNPNSHIRQLIYIKYQGNYIATLIIDGDTIKLLQYIDSNYWVRKTQQRNKELQGVKDYIASVSLHDHNFESKIIDGIKLIQSYNLVYIRRVLRPRKRR
jgi:predicted class III extradiol MEMO1 family dioxygenase